MGDANAAGQHGGNSFRPCWPHSRRSVECRRARLTGASSPTALSRSRRTVVPRPAAEEGRSDLREFVIENGDFGWEKSRVRAPLDQRRATGATERSTGLTRDDLLFTAEFQTVHADRDLAAAFGLPRGTRLVRRCYRTQPGPEGKPFSLVTSYLVHSMVKSNPDLLSADAEPWPGGTQHQLHTVGIEVQTVIQRCRAVLPTAKEAEELGIDHDTPVIALHTMLKDTGDRVVEVSDVILPGRDRSTAIFTTHLPRW